MRITGNTGVATMTRFKLSLSIVAKLNSPVGRRDRVCAILLQFCSKKTTPITFVLVGRNGHNSRREGCYSCKTKVIERGKIEMYTISS